MDVEALAKEAGQVAGAEQDQRGAAERRDQQAVDQEADREAGHRAGQAAAEQAERDDDRGQHVGAGVEQLDPREERELQQDREDRDRGEAGEDLRRDDHPRDPPVSTWTRSRLAMSA